MLASKLTAVARRIALTDILCAMGAGAGAGLVVLLALAPFGISRATTITVPAAIAFGIASWLLARRRAGWSRAAAARLLERVRPESRNVIVTAEELGRSSRDVRPPIVARVTATAAGHAAKIPTGSAAPLLRPVLICAGAVLAWAVAAAMLPTAISPTRLQPQQTETPEDPSSRALRIVATLSPPAYVGSQTVRLENPERIEAIAGTRLSLVVSGRVRGIDLRLGRATVETSPVQGGLAAELTLAETTYLAVEAGEPADSGSRRLIPIVVTPDRAPSIRIERPGKDLLLPVAEGTIPVSASATDDLGMAAMELRFTKVSGSGEQFAFEEGVLPLQIRRESERAWNGMTALALTRLNLQPGDALVYRVVGTDRRGGDAGAASSDTFFVEIAGPGEVTLAGFELPPDRDRYGLSQQMIVLKIQRLRARAKSITPEAVEAEAAGIAAEQRAVRANFIFLTGGHVEDEVEEAEHSHEIQEGRLEHRARQEITAAIGHMSRAEQALAAVNTANALKAARAAVEALQRAFARNRYLLRTLPVRSRLDPSRRLTGDSSEAADFRRARAEPETDPARTAAREILAALLDATPAILSGSNRADSTRLAALAEQALSVDAASEEWGRISAAVLRIKEAVDRKGSAAEIATHLAETVALVQRESQRDAAPGVAPDPRSRALNGAWFDQVVRR